MTFDFKTQADMLVITAGLLAEIDLDGLTDAIRNAHTLGPIIDPTRYRDTSQRGSLERIGRLVQAARAVVREYEAIEQEVTAR